jgi:hypothetical protein
VIVGRGEKDSREITEEGRGTRDEGRKGKG